MKIYDTYRLLFESDEELLDEVAWSRILERKCKN